MQLHFSKMHGLGNDFVVIDAIRQTVRLTSAQIRCLARRRFGIGCDQVLLVEAPTRPDALFRYRIFNADGGEVNQCGNGARCFARFVRDEGLTAAAEIPVETAAGLLVLQLEADGAVTVNMGQPQWTPMAIPLVVEQPALSYTVEHAGESYQFVAVGLGNPHAVLQVEAVAAAPVQTLGKVLQQDPRFPESVNVGFMQIDGRDHIRLRVLERGVGETLACGSGACAAVVAGRRLGLLEETVVVELSGGRLRVSWAGSDAPVYLTGPAERVFEGKIEV